MNKNNSAVQHLLAKLVFGFMMLMLSAIVSAQIPTRIIVNSGFELPVIETACGITSTTPNTRFIDSDLVDGWQTTHPLIDNNFNGQVCNETVFPLDSAIRPMEIWQSGALGVTSQEDDQHVELNAVTASRLFQQVCLLANEEVDFSFYHRHRSGGDETIRASLLSADGVTEFGGQNNIVDGTESPPWELVSGSLTNNGTTDLRQFAFEAVSGGASGNFLDGVVINLRPIVEMSAPAITSGPEAATNLTIPLLINGTLDNSATFTLTLVGLSTATPTADYSVSTGALSGRGTVDSFDGATGTITITLPAGEYDPNQTSNANNEQGVIVVPLNIVNDAIPEPDETIIYQIGNITVGGGNTSERDLLGEDASCNGNQLLMVTQTIEGNMPNLPNPDAFTCSGEALLSQNTSLSQIDQSASPFTFTTINPDVGVRINGIGFRPTDGLLYGFARSGTGPGSFASINQIDRNGNVVSLGVPSPSISPGANALAAGDVSADGNTYYLHVGGDNLSGNFRRLHAIDISDSAQAALPGTPLPNTQGLVNGGLAGTFFDFSFRESDGLLYTVSSTGNLVVIDPTTFTRNDFALPGVASASYGATWFNASGSLFAFDNSGDIYQIDVDARTGVLVSSGVGSGDNDGAACIQDLVGVAKNMTATSSAGGLSVTVAFNFENFQAGSTAVNLTALDDLTAVFGTVGTDWTFTSITSASGAFHNSSYNGSSNTELIASGASLPFGSGNTETITVQIELLNSNAAVGDQFCNQVNVEAQDGISPVIFSDLSTSGTDPDGTDNDGSPDESLLSCLDITSFIGTPTVSKSFSPNTIGLGGTSTLTIDLGNAGSLASTLTAAMTDTLPSGVVVATPPNQAGNCPGSVTANAGAGSIDYDSGGTIPTGGCSITVQVTSNTAGLGTVINTIPAGELETNQGNNVSAANAGFTIIDDAEVNISGPGSVVEGESTGDYTVTIDQTVPAGNSVTVNLSYSGTATDGTDYTGVTSVVISGGSNSNTFTIPTIDDVFADSGETIIIDIESIVDTDSSFGSITEGTNNQLTTTINDQTGSDGTPSAEDTVLANIAGPVSVEEGATTTPYTVTLDETVPTGGSVTVNLTYTGTATDGSDFTGVTSVVIPAGSNNATFTLPTIDDALADDGETIVIDIASVVDTNNSFEAVGAGPNNQLTTTINDETSGGPDEDAVLVNLAGPSSGVEGEATTDYTVMLDEAVPAGGSVTVNLSYSGTATDGSDFTGVTSVTIPAGSDNTTFSIDVLNDAIADDGETIIIDIASIVDNEQFV